MYISWYPDVICGWEVLDFFISMLVEGKMYLIPTRGMSSKKIVTSLLEYHSSIFIPHFLLQIFLEIL